MPEKPRPPEGAEEEKIEPSSFLAIPEYIKTNEPPVNELLGAARNGDKNARLFFAQLQLIESYPRDDRRILQSLKEVSRDMATSLDNLKKTPEEVHRDLTELARFFNGSDDRRFSVQVPGIGSSIDRSYMAPMRSNVEKVRKIHTWAVRNDKGIAEYKAEVE